MSYNAAHAVRLKDIKTLGNKFNSIVNVDNAGAHNAIYRGENLGVFSAAHSAAIRAGTFKNIYCGDCWVFSNISYTYLDENDNQQSSTYSGTMRVADLDYYLKSGDTETSAHHAVVVPDTSMYSAPMNDTNTTEGGYVGSKMRTVHLRRAEAIFKACFGENHVLTYRDNLVNAVNNGKPSGSLWCDCLVELTDERMVYGACQYDSGNQDGVTNNIIRQTVSCKQLNLFRHRPDLISNRMWFWMRNINLATAFVCIFFGGNCASYSPLHSGGVRPAALIY